MEEVAMFTKVHHVTYVVQNVQEMAEYLEKNFGMKPESADEFPDRGYKSILYRVGPTIVDFFEHTWHGVSRALTGYSVTCSGRAMSYGEMAPAQAPSGIRPSA